MSAEIWIGKAEVEQRPGTCWLPDRNFAYSQTIAYAENKSAFYDACRAFWDQNGFDLLGLEDAEPIRLRFSNGEPESDIKVLILEVLADGKPRHGTLFTWTSEDE